MIEKYNFTQQSLTVIFRKEENAIPDSIKPTTKTLTYNLLKQPKNSKPRRTNHQYIIGIKKAPIIFGKENAD